jgi:hypothetical protein
MSDQHALNHRDAVGRRPGLHEGLETQPEQVVVVHDEDASSSGHRYPFGVCLDEVWLQRVRRSRDTSDTIASSERVRQRSPARS